MIIETPSRLHLTLIDLNGNYGRIDGGVGLTIEKPRLILETEPADEDIEIIFEEEGLNEELIDDYREKIENASRNIKKSFNFKGGLTFTVRETYLAHSGLGSGTQLSVGVGKIISKIHDHEVSTRKIAEIVGRGGTSGIGVAAFDYGGFIVDGGHSTSQKPDFLPSAASKASPPPIIARYDFPEDWKLVLAIPSISLRVSGSKEVNIFQEYCPIPIQEVQKLSHILLMKMMPAVVEQDLDSFGSAVNSMQEVGFKKIEVELQTPLIKELMVNMRIAGASGVGMSSFGPTVYGLTDTNPKNMVRAAQDTMGKIAGEVIITRAMNSGAIIRE